MALGIGLFFVLAANRGWIDDRGRVALGAAASVLVFGAGLLLRSRYGQYWSAVAAVAAGLAGAYATLAAAAARYDLVPDALALPLAAVIAAAGTVVAIRWRSQVIAAIGLLGAALAPALQAIDTEMTWESAAFAVIVLVAVGAVTVSRAWHELLIVASLGEALVLGLDHVLAVEPLEPAHGEVAARHRLEVLDEHVVHRAAAERADQRQRLRGDFLGHHHAEPRRHLGDEPHQDRAAFLEQAPFGDVARGFRHALRQQAAHGEIAALRRLGCH